MRFLILLLLAIASCTPKPETIKVSSETAKHTIDSVLVSWHQAATDADFNAYYNAMHDEGIYLGTDASEHWTVVQFKAYAKPYFDKGKAWDFKTLERHIYLSEDKKVAWFDEHLDTWMGICRGSGVLTSDDSHTWKIKHYVLSLATPNDNVRAIAELNKKADSIQKNSFKR